jgi:hypothetical protein
MQTEFDKEIDSLLREGARRGRAVPAAPPPHSERGAWTSEREAEDGDLQRATPSGAHLDADEQNAYAENSLPAAARTHYASHLVDCDDCRRSVTQLALAAGTPAQLEQQATTATVQKVLPSVTWRERLGALFAPGAWRYAVPALALLLAGAVALIVSMRSSRQGESATIAQRNTTEQSRPAATEMHHAAQNSNAAAINAAPGDAGAPDASNSNATQAKEELAANTVSRTEMAPQQPVVGTVSSADEPPPPPPASAGGTAAGRAISEMPTRAGTPASVDEAVTITSAPEAKVKNVEPVGEVAKDAQRTGNFENRQQQPRERLSGPRRNMEQSRNLPRGVNTEVSRDDADRNDVANTAAPKPVAPAATAAAARRAPPREEDAERSAKLSNDAKKSEGLASSKSAAETRTVAGRKFRRQGRAWVDTAYNSSQATTIVRRNSEQYRALIADEPELRRISDALGGEVTIIWKGRAYRIR